MGAELSLIAALWFILPAYFANSMPVQLSKVKALQRYGKPIDGGRTWMGTRILGDGKTWRGLFVGVTIGTFVGVIQSITQANVEAALNVALPIMSFELAFMLSFGALIGDMTASFIKRRIGLKSGDPAPLMDQLDFIFGAFFFSWLLTGSIDANLFFIIVVMTPLIHFFANVVAWLWKLKKNPW